MHTHTQSFTVSEAHLRMLKLSGMIEVAFVGSATGAIELVRKIASILACRVKKSVVRALHREVKRVSK